MNTTKQIQEMSLPASATIRQALEAIEANRLRLVLLLNSDNHQFVNSVTAHELKHALLQGAGLNSPALEAANDQPVSARLNMDKDQISTLCHEQTRAIPILDGQGCVIDVMFPKVVKRIPVAEPCLDIKALEYVSQCVLTNWISSAGEFITRFESLFAGFCDTQHAIATSNGTTALHLALLALDIGPGDEVIVPTLTFIATANAVAYTGARPVFVDSQVETWNIDPDKIEAAITPKTKAIIAVHLYGHPADMNPILDIATQHGLAVVEDAAEAHGALYKGQKVGSLGKISMFSFYGNKNITTGEGGMVVTQDEALAKKVRVLRDHGMSPERRYWHPELGYNYRMTNIQAALGVAQMESINDLMSRKMQILDAYTKQLQDIAGITLPPHSPWAMPVCWLYSLLVDEAEFGMSRDRLADSLKSSGIDTRPFFIPIHQQPLYQGRDVFPVAEKLSEAGLNLPSAANLDMEQIKYIAGKIRELSSTST